MTSSIGARTVFQGCDALKSHSKVIWIEETRWVVQELMTGFISVQIVDRRDNRRTWTFLIETIDIFYTLAELKGRRERYNGSRWIMEICTKGGTVEHVRTPLNIHQVLTTSHTYQ